jgi:hypothetical protein
MLVKSKQRDLARAIAKTSEQHEELVQHFISPNMTAFLAGVSKKLDKDVPLYVIMVDVSNKWLKTQSDEVIQSAIGLHGQFSSSLSVACGKALKFFGGYLDTQKLMINGDESSFNFATKDPKRHTYNHLFSAFRIRTLPTSNSDSDAKLVKKTLAGITAHTDNDLIHKKLSSLSFDKRYNLTSKKNENIESVNGELIVNKIAAEKCDMLRASFPDVDREVMLRYLQWSPLIPTANGTCKHIQGFLKDVFGADVKLSAIQNLVSSCFGTTWNHVTSNENNQTPGALFNTMAITLSYGRAEPYLYQIGMPIYGFIHFMKLSQSESRFDILWGGGLGEFPVVTAHIPGDDEPPIGMKYTVNIDLLDSEKEIKEFLSHWEKSRF